tara:strand:+ start:29 stop:316 length:288 start_codon:yes stop_codon:yes gene_type:complete
MPNNKSGFKMYGKSPMMKRLIGKQHNLPEYLKAKIEASPAQQKARNLTAAEAKEEAKAQEAKAENEGQQIIGRIERGEITKKEGNKQLAILQKAK